MYPRAFLERVLSHLEARGHLGPRARARVFSLLSHGLHPEQVLIGAGVVSLQEYRTLLKELTGLSVEPVNAPGVFPDGLSREESRRLFVVPIAQEGDIWRIGYVEPWNQSTRERIQALAQAHAWQEDPKTLLFSEWRRLYPAPSSTLRHHLRLARSVRATQGGVPLQQTWFVDAFHPRTQLQDPRLAQRSLPGSQLPALARRLQRDARRQDVIIELKATEYGPVIVVHREVEEGHDHPTSWMQTLLTLQQQPQEGLSLLLGVDPHFSALMRGASTGEATNLESWREDELIRLTRPKPEQQEELIHAIIAGKKAIVHIPHPQEPWWEALHEAGVPVRVIHKQLLPEGESWVSYSI